jgi:hypothetical protein
MLDGLLLLVSIIYATGRCYPKSLLMAIRQLEIANVSIPSIETVGPSRIVEAVEIADRQDYLDRNIAAKCCFDSVAQRFVLFPNLFNVWR